MKKYLLYIFTIIGLILLLVSGLFYVYPSYSFNFELVISFLSVIYIMTDTNLKYFPYLWMKIIFTITVVFQTFTTCFSVFVNINIVNNLNILTSTLIIGELSIYTIIKLFSEYIWNDVKVLELKTNKRIRSIQIKNNSELDDVNIIFDDINKWIRKNKNNLSSRQRDFQKVMKLLLNSVSATESLIVKRNYSLSEISGESNEKEMIMVDILEDSYYVMRKDIKLLHDYLNLFFIVIKTSINLNNDKVLRKYLELYIKFLSIEIQSNNPKNVFIVMNKLYFFIDSKRELFNGCIRCFI